MQLIDSHTHIYGEEFDEDRDEMLARATAAGVGQMVLPNVDAASYPRVLDLCAAHPDRLFPTIGLHPTYVKEDYTSQLDYMERELSQRPHVAIGEIGLDYYWDTTYQREQIEAFERQLHYISARPLLMPSRHCVESISRSFVESSIALLAQEKSLRRHYPSPPSTLGSMAS